MEILHLTAMQFLQPMGTGRTRPVLLGAEDSDGQLFEVVVKLRGPEMTAKAQIAELVAAPLADLLGIDVPQAGGGGCPCGVRGDCAARLRGSGAG